MVASALYGILGIALFLCGIFTVYKANMPKDQRYKQLLLPVVAVIFGVLAVVFFNNINATLQRFITWLAGYLPVISQLNTTFLVECLFNFALLFAFSIIKGLYRGLIALLKRPFEKLFKPAIEYFYVFNDENGHWFLRKAYCGVRLLMRNMYVTAVVLASLLFLLGYIFPAAAPFQNPAYPAFVVLVLGEFTFCLSGITLEEYNADMEFEKDDAQRITQYAKLQEVLEHYFKDRELKALTRGQRKASAGTHNDFCEGLIASNNYEERLAGRYFLTLVERGVLRKNPEKNQYDELNHDAVMASVKLLQGKSVMFASPFYRDFTPYIFFPLNAQLIRNKKALVLFGPQTDEDALRNFVQDGLTFVTGFPDMWEVDNLAAATAGGEGSPGAAWAATAAAEPTDAAAIIHAGAAGGAGGTSAQASNNAPDIGLLPFSSLGNVNTILQNEAFFAEVAFVIIIDPSTLLATYQIGLNILSERLTRGQAPCYCIFDKNSEGLVDSLSHALRANLTEVVATEYGTGSSVSLFWDVDGELLQHRLFPGVAHYLGVGTEIGLVALKNQVSHVSWAAGASVPLADQRWIDGQYYGELLRFAELPQEQLQLDKHFSFYNDLWSMRKEPHCFAIVEDECCNMFEVFRQFSTRGSNDAFVNVLSPNYLLRDYMVENSDYLAADAKAIASFAPDFSKGARNVILSLIMIMVQQDNFIAEDEIRARLRYIGWPAPEGVKCALESLLIEHIAVSQADNPAAGAFAENHLVEREQQIYDRAQKRIITKRFYGLNNAAAYAECFRDLKNVPIITEQPDGSTLLLGARLYGHVYQSYLPGQFVVVQGKYYEVVSISEGAGVVLRRAADHFAGRTYYRQLRTYGVTDVEPSQAAGAAKTIAGIKVHAVEANISVETQGYLDMDDYGNVAGAKRVELNGIPARNYCHKTMLALEFPGAGAAVIGTLACLISEFMITLFPNDYPYIAVVVPDTGVEADGAGRWASPSRAAATAAAAAQGAGWGTGAYLQGGPALEGVLPKYVGAAKADTIYLIEDSLVDIGLISSLSRNIERILELCWEFLDWHVDMLAGRRAEEHAWEVGDCPEFVPPAKKGRMARVRDFFKRHFGRKEKGAGAAASPTAAVAAPTPSEADAEGSSAPVIEREVEPAPTPAPESANPNADASAPAPKAEADPAASEAGAEEPSPAPSAADAEEPSPACQAAGAEEPSPAAEGAMEEENANSNEGGADE